MLQNPITAKSQFFGKIKIRKKALVLQLFKSLKKLKDFHQRAGKRTNDFLVDYLIFYTF
jgi:hypothetical protein